MTVNTRNNGIGKPYCRWTTRNIFAKHYRNFIRKNPDDYIVVSPDVGSVSRARTFAMKLGLNLAIIDKRREKANQSEVMNIIGSVEGKNCLILDDIVDQIRAGQQYICGAMIESYIKTGHQDIVSNGKMMPGISLTDPCLGLKETEEAILNVYENLP